MKAKWNMFDGLKLSLLLCLGAAGVSSTGCATMVRGANQTVPISTTPSGAVVEIDGRAHQSPCALPLARRCDHTIVVSKEGYQSETRQIARKPTGAIYGNIWLGGLIGMLVDALTGANNDLVPDHLEITLTPADNAGGQPLAAAPSARPPGMRR